MNGSLGADRLVEPWGGRSHRWAWKEVALAAIANNMRRARSLLAPHVMIMAIVKGDAYGHGAVAVSRTAVTNGATFLGVSCIREAVELREAGIESPILLLGASFPEDVAAIIDYNLTPTVFDKATVRELGRHARRRGARVKVHMKVDTGLHRIGVTPDNAVDFARFVVSQQGMELEGLYTHLAMADANRRYTAFQISVFDQVRFGIRTGGIVIPIEHAANSAAIAWHPRAHYSLVRMGLALYGVAPQSRRRFPIELVPALTLKSRVTRIERTPPGSRIGYAGARPRIGQTVVATLAIGYADGVRRGPSTFPGALIRGHRVPIVSPVCMDQTIVDITDGPPSICVGDEAVLIGCQASERISVDEVARAVGTVPNEVLTGLGARLGRRYDLEGFAMPRARKSRGEYPSNGGHA